MATNEREVLDRLAEIVVGAAYEVANTLGIGFAEKVYEKALIIELGLRGVAARGQAEIDVRYKGQSAGIYYPDILVDERLILEIKCVEEFCSGHVAQCLNYLKATGLHLALLINFKRPKVEWKRVVYNFPDEGRKAIPAIEPEMNGNKRE